MAFTAACPTSEYIDGAETRDGSDAVRFRDYAGTEAAPWSHVDWQYALGWPAGALAFPNVPTDSSAPVQRYEMALTVATFAGVTRGARFTVMLDSTPPVCSGNHSAAVQVDYTTIHFAWFMEDPDSGLMAALLCVCARACVLIELISRDFVVRVVDKGAGQPFGFCKQWVWDSTVRF